MSETGGGDRPTRTGRQARPDQPGQLVWLVDGDDATLVAEEVRRLVAELVGAGAEASLSVEDFWGDEVDLDAVTGACLTPPFLGERRVVVLRDAGRFSTEDLRPLLVYLEDPLPTTALVVAGGGGRLAPKLVAAVKGISRVISIGPGRDLRHSECVQDQRPTLRFRRPNPGS